MKTATPVTDAAQKTARLGYQAISDNNWPWSAINEGWDHARVIERDRDRLRELLRDIRNHQGGNRYNYEEITVLVDEALA